MQATWRQSQGRAVVHVFGRLESGQTFLVRDGRSRPRFFIEQKAMAAAARLGAAVRASDWRSLRGVPLACVEVGVPADVPPLRDGLRAAGIVTSEADVRFATRYLIDRGIRGGVAIEGAARPGRELGLGVDLVFDEPELHATVASVSLRCLSFDIETDPDAARVLAIALHSPETSEVLLVDDQPASGTGRSAPPVAQAIALVDTTPFGTERELLAAFAARVRRLDPDVLTGWNVVDFDFTVLERRARALRVPFELGRMGGALRLRLARGFFGRSEAQIPGRIVLDGIALLQGAFVRMDDYSLAAVAASVLGEGKAIAPAAANQRAGEILRMYQQDRAAFVHYARTDARLAYDIVHKLRLIELAVERSRLTGMPPDRVAASIAAFDHLYLSALTQRHIAAPDVGNADAAPSAQAGGHVLEPEPGLHTDVLVFDFRSLYPSIIRTFNLDPLAFVHDAAASGDFVLAPNGARFDREPAILPHLLDDLFARRAQAKRDGDAIADQAIKILMNSFYGVLGTPACRFYNAAIGNAITSFGKLILTWSQRWFERRGHRVLYGDTDSLFVVATSSDRDAVFLLARVLAGDLNAALSRLVARRWRVVSRLELQFAKHYLRLFLPSMRSRSEGARKRYAGLLATPEGSQLDFVGMEVVRRDWTPLAKHVQRALYARLFADEPVDAYLHALVGAVRAGAHDDDLVYRKGLRKSLAAYERTTPPHVLAARKLREAPGRTIDYVMTLAGPEPAVQCEHPLDREHYVQKQVRPVAEPVLSTLGLDFDTVVGDQRQMSLF